MAIWTLVVGQWRFVHGALAARPPQKKRREGEVLSFLKNFRSSFFISLVVCNHWLAGNPRSTNVAQIADTGTAPRAKVRPAEAPRRLLVLEGWSESPRCAGGYG